MKYGLYPRVNIAVPLLAGGLLVLLCSGRPFSFPDNIRPKIRQEVESRIAELRKKEAESCRLQAIEKAERAVDSTIIAQLSLLQIPYARPSRPPKPGETPPIDTVPLKPLFSLAQLDSLLQDSVLLSLDSLLDQMELRAGLQKDTLRK